MVIRTRTGPHRNLSRILRERPTDDAWKVEALASDPNLDRSTPMSERELFIAALQKDPADRPALLNQVCADDPALRRRVEVLLKAHDLAGGLLDLPAESGLATDAINPTGVATS